MELDINKIGLNFDNSFSLLSNILMTEIQPTPVKSPKLIIFNQELAKNLDLNLPLKLLKEKKLANLLSGNELPKGSKSLAEAYAGHQFGHFTMLGDGRAILIGEHITKNNNRYDIQLKGSGRTPYSRNGDGRATLVSMLREYLISEAMFGLNIPTTRSLSVVSTGENIQREEVYTGGILTRIAASHIRVGTFQYVSMKGDLKSLKELINYSLKRHFPNNYIDINPAVTLLKALINTQISLIVEWMRVGFIHGVMNTDNMTISGETIDYGPCAFMDTYNPQTVFSSIDHNGRYSFINQSLIAHWNISRFAETLIPFLDKSEDKAIKIGRKIINEFEDLFEKKWLIMMQKKLGFYGHRSNDLDIIKKLLNWMEKNKADYTNTFLHLTNNDFNNNNIYKNNSFIDIKKGIENRKLQNIEILRNNKINPLVIPRNYIVEKSLINIEHNDNYDLFNDLLKILKNPFNPSKDIKNFQNPSNEKFENTYKTYRGT